MIRINKLNLCDLDVRIGSWIQDQITIVLKVQPNILPNNILNK